jgi:hypothetical protein
LGGILPVVRLAAGAFTACFAAVLQYIKINLIYIIYLAVKNNHKQ